MKTSIVIPAWNEEHCIDNLLADIAKQTQKADEVIVVDANSTDKTRDIIKQYAHIKILKTKPSIPYQRNVGARAAKNDIIIFLDADCEISENFLQKAISELIEKDLAIACPFYLCHTKNLFILAFVYFINAGLFLFQKILPSGAGNCIIIKKSVFEKSNGFDETLQFEDIEFIRRIGKKHRFAMLSSYVFASPRRFYEEGVLKTIFFYLFLSILNVFGVFRFTNRIPYKYGNHR